MTKLAVVAVGGNALVVDDKKMSAYDQYENVMQTAHHIVDMIEAGWQVVVTHGNGPQVGHIVRRSELSKAELPIEPLDYAVADTQGSIGYMFQNALGCVLEKRGIQKPVATIVTQTLVSQDDPAFKRPSKPIGAFMSQEVAKQREKELGWSIMEDAGRGWRRCVASPTPLKIIELETIATLLKMGQLVVACGGGGIPVKQGVAKGELIGVEAVIDKDLASSLLASSLKADLLLIPTGVEQVAINFGTPQQKWLSQLTIQEALEYSKSGEFGEGSMQPKVNAILNFLKNNIDGSGLITSPEAIKRALNKETGTWILGK